MKHALRLPLAGLILAACAGSSLQLVAAEKAALQDRVSAAQTVGFDVYIPIQHRAQLEQDLQALNNTSSPMYHKWLTPAEFHARYGATEKQLTDIKNQLESYGLQTSTMTGHRIHVTGRANNVEQALGTPLHSATYQSGRAVIAATGRLSPPDAMTQAGAVVVGLSHNIRMKSHAHQPAKPDNRYSTTGGYWFDDLKQAYKFPSYKTFTGKGITIATLVDGAYSPADMDKYFSHEKLATPHFSEINVDGGSPFNGNSFETNLDFQQAGGIAPNAKLIHYNIPDLSDQSIIDGLSQIVSDNKADIVSMSFGGPERFYLPADNDGTDFTYLIKLEDDLMAQGNAQGITFIASTGDAGALTAPPVICFTGVANCGVVRASVEFPASSPHVTGVGGTNLITVNDGKTLNSTYVRESAYADPLVSDIFYGTSATGSSWGSGGGNSLIFTKPFFQAFTNTGSIYSRTLPDVSLHMGGCPNGVKGTCNADDSFDYEVFNGSYVGVIGTSAAAPDFAGLVALGLEQLGGRFGNANYYIYSLAILQDAGLPINAYKKNIPGFNGLYHTTPTGYNRVLGNGTINGVNFLLNPKLPVAGLPQTPSNP